jgi:hypothetical protein
LADHECAPKTEVTDNELQKFGARTYRFVKLPPVNFVTSRTFRFYVWLTTGSDFRDFVIFFVETTKVVCILTLAIGASDMVYYQCFRPVELLETSLPLSPVGGVVNDMRCDSEFVFEFVRPTLRDYYTPNQSAFWVNQTFFNAVAFAEESLIQNNTYLYACDLYDHLCDEEYYSPQKIKNNLVTLLCLECVTFVLLLAFMPTVDLVHKRGFVLKKAEGRKKTKVVCYTPVLDSKKDDLKYNYFLVVLAAVFFCLTAGYWATLERFIRYTTYLNVICQLSHDLWYFTRPLAIIYILLATAMVLPIFVHTAVRAMNMKEFKHFVDDEAIIASRKFLQINSEYIEGKSG